MNVVEFIVKVKSELKNKPDGILVAQVIRNIKLSNEDKDEIAKFYGFPKWDKAWKIIEKIPDFEITGPDDSKSVRLKNIKVDSNGLHERVTSLLKYLNSSLKEKEEAVRLVLLASIAGESIFLLGPPGTAKSMVSRRVRNAFIGKNGVKLSYFEYLMNQFSTPDELFGPVSLKSLENDEYKRITQGFLPDADVAFLDEIWKAGPAIQNTLLTIINEKKFHNGKEVNQVPLKALISASNELPAENQGLEALWDRFLIRTIVNPIQDEENFLNLVCGDDVKPELKPTESMEKNLISVEELEKWKTEIIKIEVPEDVRNVITAIRQEMAVRNNEKKRAEKEKFYVSDRRWKKIVNILKTSAYLNGRKTVDLMDLQLIEYCIWNTELQIEEAKEIVKTCIAQNGLEVDTAIDDINEQIKDFDQYVNKEFYKEKRKPKIYKMNDGAPAYKVSNPSEIYTDTEIVPYYISIEKNLYYSEHIGAYYDDDKKMMGDDRFYDWYPMKHNSASITDSTLKWIGLDDDDQEQNYEVEIEMEKNTLEIDPVFKDHPDLLELRQKNADKNKYNPILNSIKNEIKNIDEYLSEKAAPYKKNLFADQKMYHVILTAVEKSKFDLEKAESDLNKIREKYMNQK